MAFAERENYPFALTTRTDWVLGAMPPEHGLLLNMGTVHYLEWSAEGIRRFGAGLIGYPLENSVEFDPSNRLEVFLKKWQAGEISWDEFFPVLVKSDLYVPSTAVVSGDVSGLMPLFFWGGGHSFASAFTISTLMNLHKDGVKGVKGYLFGLPYLATGRAKKTCIAKSSDKTHALRGALPNRTETVLDDVLGA